MIRTATSRGLDDLIQVIQPLAARQERAARSTNEWVEILFCCHTLSDEDDVDGMLAESLEDLWFVDCDEDVDGL